MLFEKYIVGAFRKMMYARCDDTKTVFYFSPADFPGLQVEPHRFHASAGHWLQGYFYQYENAVPNRLIVFDHGFGGGHRAYMTEIAMLCAHGYRVFAYDHTGCMESDGDTPNGLAQSLCDLNDCIIMLKSDARFENTVFSVMGHSWGAFSTLNITALHPEISHIVALAGFVCVDEVVSTFFPGILKGYRKAIIALEQSSNPDFSHFHAAETLVHSKSKALLVYSDDDPLVQRKHYDLLRNALGNKENIRLLLVSRKGHNPNYTEDAVKYLKAFTAARTKLLKRKSLTDDDFENFVSSFDWKRMTAQDPILWQEIFAHLDN